MELARLGPTLFAAVLLADLGAEVVCVDRPGAASPPPGDPRDDPLNRGKRSIAVDLKHPAGIELLLARPSARRAARRLSGPACWNGWRVVPEATLRRHPRLVNGRMISYRL